MTGTPSPADGPIDVVFGDDSYLIREAMRQLLDGVEGINLVAVCADGTELWQSIVDHAPRVVVTDLRMPPSGDDEAIRISDRLRRTYPQVDDPAYGRALLQAGADGRAYLLKERIHERTELVSAIRLVAAGGTAVDPVIVERLISGSGASRRSAVASLTQREREVLRLMAAGMSNGAIAEELVLSRRAVEKHVGAIFSKLGLDDEVVVSRRVMAVLRYLESDRGQSA
jgi:DNA-binding NarL/FixJ family response regulator